MRSFIVDIVLSRLLTKTTLVGLILAALTYLGFTVAPDCEGVDHCINEEMWARITESAGYLVAAGLVFRKGREDLTDLPKPTETVVKNSELERVQQEYPERRR